MSAASNPFRSERVIALPYRPQSATWTELLRDLEALDWRGAVVGPCGTGKTTLLEQLAPEMEERGFCVHFYRLDSAQKRLPPAFWERCWESGDAILLDGAEQMRWWGWQRFRFRTRRSGALIVSSHRAGLLKTWVRTTTSPELLYSLCDQLGVEVPMPQLERIFEAHKGNLRLCLMKLYDRVQEKCGPTT